MQLPRLNLWYLLAAGIIAILLITSNFGIGVRAFMFGNPCGDGFIYNEATGACQQVQTQMSCGTGTYLKFTQAKGYACELSNFSLAILFASLIVAAYFYASMKRQETWRPAELCFKNAINGGHLKTRRQNWRDAWDSVEEIHQILPRSAWLFVGDFVTAGESYSAMVSGTDDKGWVLDGWRMRLEERQINILKKQSMKLEQALTTIAQEKQRVDAAAAAFQSEQAELVA